MRDIESKALEFWWREGGRGGEGGGGGEGGREGRRAGETVYLVNLPLHR